MNQCGEECCGAPPHGVRGGRLDVVGIYTRTTGFLHIVFIFQGDNEGETGGAGLRSGSS
jgi:hypothetical protein